MELKKIDFDLKQIEDLCAMFKLSMFTDSLPIPSTQVFFRYLDRIIDDSIVDPDSNSKNRHGYVPKSKGRRYDLSNLNYCLNLLKDLHSYTNPALLFDRTAEDFSKVDNIKDFRDLENPIYSQMLSYYRQRTNSEKNRIYSDYMTTLHRYISKQLEKIWPNIELQDDFTAKIKLRSNVAIGKIKNVIAFLQQSGYIASDPDTYSAFLSLFEGSLLAVQMMKIPWKFMSATAGEENKPVQNIAALYVLFETLGVDLKSKDNRRIIEFVFLESGTLKSREMSKILTEFKEDILKLI